MKCIITGCAFLEEGGTASLWGDLFEEGDCYIFNGPVDGRWDYNRIPPPEIKQVRYTGSYHFFERRGIVVVPKKDCALNHAAREYLKI